MFRFQPGFQRLWKPGVTEMCGWASCEEHWAAFALVQQLLWIVLSVEFWQKLFLASYSHIAMAIKSFPGRKAGSLVPGHHISGYWFFDSNFLVAFGFSHAYYFPSILASGRNSVQSQKGWGIISICSAFLSCCMTCCPFSSSKPMFSFATGEGLRHCFPSLKPRDSG